MGSEPLRRGFLCPIIWQLIEMNDSFISQNAGRTEFGGSILKPDDCIILRAMEKPVIAVIMDPVERLGCTYRLTWHVIRKITSIFVIQGVVEFGKLIEIRIITTVVGTGQWGFNGDGPALEVNLTYPASIVFDHEDNLYIADTQAHRIRKYDPRTGLVSTIAGFWTDEDDERVSPLTAQNLIVLSGDAIGIDFSDDQGWLRPQCSDGLDMTPYLDDGKPALECRLYDLVSLDIFKNGDLLITDKGTNRIRRLDMGTGIISTIAGVCRFGYDGDDKLAVKAMLNVPEGAVADDNGNVYIADSMNHRVRKVDATTGIISTIAGNGDSGYDDKNMGGCGAARFVAKEDATMLKHGDGRLAVEAIVNSPAGLVLDSQGVLYICERNENKIRRVKVIG